MLSQNIIMFFFLLEQHEPNHCNIMQWHALLGPRPCKALSWACPKTARHESWFYHACPYSAWNFLLALADSALVLPCTELDPALLVLSLPVPFGYPRLEKSPNNFNTHGYIRETLRPVQH